ncbi:MAG: hypothetical protein BWX45_00069 [Deltaproteobacteria bacterium ADurb.Bin002]|nr:MAG: hypothetical protein BWX45_00069 [Deltaproteobacteria bacterium ADurb.Bin002]
MGNRLRPAIGIDADHRRAVGGRDGDGPCAVGPVSAFGDRGDGGGAVTIAGLPALEAADGGLGHCIGEDRRRVVVGIDDRSGPANVDAGVGRHVIRGPSDAVRAAEVDGIVAVEVQRRVVPLALGVVPVEEDDPIGIALFPELAFGVEPGLAGRIVAQIIRRGVRVDGLVVASKTILIGAGPFVGRASGTEVDLHGEGQVHRPPLRSDFAGGIDAVEELLRMGRRAADLQERTVPGAAFESHAAVRVDDPVGDSAGDRVTAFGKQGHTAEGVGLDVASAPEIVGAAVQHDRIRAVGAQTHRGQGVSDGVELVGGADPEAQRLDASAQAVVLVGRRHTVPVGELFQTATTVLELLDGLIEVRNLVGAKPLVGVLVLVVCEHDAGLEVLDLAAQHLPEAPQADDGFGSAQHVGEIGRVGLPPQDHVRLIPVLARVEVRFPCAVGELDRLEQVLEIVRGSVVAPDGEQVSSSTEVRCAQIQTTCFAQRELRDLTERPLHRPVLDLGQFRARNAGLPEAGAILVHVIDRPTLARERVRTGVQERSDPLRQPTFVIVGVSFPPSIWEVDLFERHGGAIGHAVESAEAARTVRGGRNQLIGAHADPLVHQTAAPRELLELLLDAIHFHPPGSLDCAGVVAVHPNSRKLDDVLAQVVGIIQRPGLGGAVVFVLVLALG